MKKLLVLLIVGLLAIPGLAADDPAGHNKIVTLGDVLTLSYAYTAGWLAPSQRYTVVDSTTMKAIINAKGGPLCRLYGAALRRDTSKVTTAGTERYALPTDFLKAIYVQVIDTSGTILDMQEVLPEEFGQHRDDEGAPKYYRIFNYYLQVAPVNATGDTLVIEYWATNNTLSATTDTSNIDYGYLDLWALMVADAALTARQTPSTAVINQRLEIIRQMLADEQAHFQGLMVSPLDRQAK